MLYEREGSRRHPLTIQGRGTPPSASPHERIGFILVYSVLEAAEIYSYEARHYAIIVGDNHEAHPTSHAAARSAARWTSRRFWAIQSKSKKHDTLCVI